ncbi:MAG TPA: hypothetical protein VD757_02420 [Candidatus Nitrosocosmicus sp.]|nr:hypothetical protein [Candidatus Nitrosocosmicus sp.]
MENKAYEKVVNGGSLNKVFGKIEKLDIFEDYRIHVETVDGSKNNYIINIKNGHKDISDLYVSNDNMTGLKMI